MRYKDYVAVLAEAGVDVDRLSHDLLLDTDLCCNRELLSAAPLPDGEYVERLNALKAIRLFSPPPYYLSYQGEEERPFYHRGKAGGSPTNAFVGAELYYYLVERGENPTTALQHLHIRDERDVKAILEVTSRPSNEFECTHCGEYIPHAKFLSHLYKTRKDQADILLERPDRLHLDCCRDNVMTLTLTENEKRAAELKARAMEDRHSGLPVDKEAPEYCISCGDTSVQNYLDYEWLVHRGIPPVVALNYFGLDRLCCRQSMMNPRIVPRESAAVILRRVEQDANMPKTTEIDFDYESKKLPPVQGTV